MDLLEILRRKGMSVCIKLKHKVTKEMSCEYIRTYDSVSKACPFGAKRALLGHYCHIFTFVVGL
jgi:hypothetical protein